ncbi:ABC transporter ATP-binding protein [Bacillus sp. FSL W7-1360]
MNKHHLLKLLRLVDWPKKLIVFTMLLAIVTAVLGLSIPILTKNVIDAFSTETLEMTAVFWLAAVFLLNAILGGISYYMLRYIGEYTICCLRDKMWDHVLRLPVRYFDQHETGQTVSRLTGDVSTMNSFVSQEVPDFLTQILVVIGAVVMLFVQDWQLTLAMLASVPVLMLVILPVGKFTYAISQKTQTEMARFIGMLSRSLSEIRLVKSHSAENKEYKRVMGSVQDLFKLNLKAAKIQAIVSPVVMATIMLILLVLVGYGGLRLANGTITPGTFVAVVFYLVQAIFPITAIVTFFTQYKATAGATERLYEIYAMPQEEMNVNDTPSPLEEGKLAVQHLSFAYNEKQPVLKDVSFTVKPNRMMAIVGPSGSGKTTLFQLIERMYETPVGAIAYNGLPIMELPLANWRKVIGYVMQDSAVMNGTIRDNILYGIEDEEEVEESQMIAYAKLANAHDFIVSFPDGYDTEVGERGVKLSGGQKQRIAIARAFMINPKILLLDEATANLDSESERMVQEAMYKLMEGRTTIVIAHRLSTIRDADQIVFLDKGEVTGIGKHHELMQTHAKYRDFVREQSLKDQQDVS